MVIIGVLISILLMGIENQSISKLAYSSGNVLYIRYVYMNEDLCEVVLGQGGAASLPATI